MSGRTGEAPAERGRAAKAFDPLEIGDPLAARTGWWPMRGSGTSSFRSHRLVHADADQVRFSPTVKLRLLLGVVPAIGAVVISGAGAGVIMASNFGPFIVQAIGGLAIVGVGLLLYYAFFTPIVFDRREGMCWKGHGPPQAIVDSARVDHYALLEDVHAVQSLRFHVSTGDGGSGYHACELNLVLHDGRRIHLLCQGHDASMGRDAQALAEFLRVPLWDSPRRS